MNHRYFLPVAGVAGVAIAPLVLDTNLATAQPNGLNGSYLGITVNPDEALGLGQNYLQQSSTPAKWFVDQALEGTQLTSGSNASATESLDGKGFQGRLDFNNMPFSLRGKVAFDQNASVVQPILSYDLAIARNTNLYAGAGYSFINSTDKAVVPNNPNAFFVTAGAEAAVSDKVVVYGDAQYPLNQADFKITSPVNVQVGIGLRF